MSKLFFLYVSVAIVNCLKPVPTPVADAATETAGDEAGDGDGKKRDDCARACTNLRALKCPERNSIDGGDTCEVACRHTQTTGLTDLKPKCLLTAKSQDEAVKCGTVKCK